MQVNAIEEPVQYGLVGFNHRRYDNHILHAWLMDHDNKQLYHLSQKIINGEPNCHFEEAYNPCQFVEDDEWSIKANDI